MLLKICCGWPLPLVWGFGFFVLVYEYVYDNEYGTKQDKNQMKDEIELQYI